MVVRLTWDGRLIDAWQWRSDRRVRAAFGLGPLPSFSRWADHRNPEHGGLRLDVGHLNAVATRGDDLLVGLGVVRRPRLPWSLAAAATASRSAQRLGLERPVRAAVDAAAAFGPGRRFLGHRAIASVPGFDRPPPSPGTRRDWTWAVLELPGAARGLPRRTRARVVASHPSAGLPAHNVVPFGDLIAVNDSTRGRVLTVDARSGAVVSAVQIEGELPFPRGLLRLDDGRFLVGVQDPARLLTVDLERGGVDEVIDLPDDRNEAPYAIAPVPDGFADPAGRLPSARAGWGIPGADASASVTT
jgi:hypothetical protein